MALRYWFEPTSLVVVAIDWCERSGTINFLKSWTKVLSLNSYIQYARKGKLLRCASNTGAFQDVLETPDGFARHESVDGLTGAALDLSSDAVQLDCNATTAVSR